VKHNCNMCDVILEVGINWTTSSLTSRYYKCSICRSKYQRKYYSENKERQNTLSRARYLLNRDSILKQQREKYIKKTFNISVEEYDNYFNNTSCGICNIDKDLVLDHCHVTSNIRGVLCRKCNMAIGLLGDNIEGIGKAMEYLNEND